MDKAKPFEDYFADGSLEADRLARMRLARKLVHEIYPDVVERTSYAMPGFYPKGSTKANQQLFLLQANKEWLGLYGTFGLTAADLAEFARYGIEVGKGSVKVPYDMPSRPFKSLLKHVIDFNLARHTSATG